MQTVGRIFYLSLRGYRGVRRGRRSAWDVPSESAGLPPDKRAEEFNSDDPEYDPDAFESDFSTVGLYHKMHEEELQIQKEKIKMHIVRRKYFQKKEPTMLTWGEKEQIRLLHTQDPEQWTPEVLSESFPASRDAITKILRSKWMPQSVKVIEKYNKRVKENWELFKAGKLAVDPELHAHLSNFKNRQKVQDADLQKFVKPKPVFPQPKSMMFSSVIQNYVSKNNTEKDYKEKERKEENLVKQITAGDKSGNEKTHIAEREAPLTYDMFLEKHTRNVDEKNITPIDRVILDEYKNQRTKDYMSDSLVLKSESPVNPSRDKRVVTATKDDSSLVDNAKEHATPQIILKKIDDHSLETGIISRQKKEVATVEDYPDSIKIHQHLYKRGTIYRIQDRYYDSDGEFLYRVPGLVS